ncbi:MAG: hypothetical protein AAGE80_05385 [Pseudomonadota bacterium]
MNPSMMNYQMQPIVQPSVMPGTQAVVSDQTARQYADMQGAVRGDGIAISFFYSMVTINNPMNMEVHGTQEVRLCVAKAIIGDGSSLSVKRISPEEAEMRYPEHYKAFTESGEVLVDGTPISELPGMTMSEMAMMAVYNVRSIEEASNLTDQQLQSIGHMGRRVKQLAIQWLTNLEENDKKVQVADAMTKLLARVDALEATNRRVEAERDAANLALAAQQKVQPGQANVQPQQVAAAPMPDYPDIDDTPNPLEDGATVIEPENDDLNLNDIIKPV